MRAIRTAVGLGLLTWAAGTVSCAVSPLSREAQRSLSSQNTEDVVMYHLGPARQGWKSNEVVLKPANVNAGGFHLRWANLEPFDSLTIKNSNGQLTEYAPHVFGSPLYLQNLELSTGEFSGQSFSVVFAATTNGVVYALNATTRNIGSTTVRPGALLWKTTPPQGGANPKPGALGMPQPIPGFDGNLPLGVLGTPIIDTSGKVPTMYVASVDAAAGWTVFAIDLSNGQVQWKTSITQASVAAPGILLDGNAAFLGQKVMSQRGALALSPDGSRLYVPFGAYNDGGTGFLVMVDTVHHKIQNAFAADIKTAMQDGKPFASGGMWAAGGPAIDTDGSVYATTGNSPVESHSSQGTWGQSLLRWDAGLHLTGTYTPFNYCQMDAGDIDLAGSSPILIDLDPATTSTPQVIAFGGKQGNVYLVDRTNLRPSSADRRNACVPANFSTAAFEGGDVGMNHPDPSAVVEVAGSSKPVPVETSLFGPDKQPYYTDGKGGTRAGPLNVFGPYQETFNNGDFAKMRSTPAYFYDSNAKQPYIFVAGTTRDMDGITGKPAPKEIAPGLVRLKIVTQANQRAFLNIDARQPDIAMLSAGSPVVTSNGPNDPIVWVLDANVHRTDPLIGKNVSHAILFAFDAMKLNVLWRSDDHEHPEDGLHVGGKYGTPAIAGGQVFVGTDGIQAYGLKEP